MGLIVTSNGKGCQQKTLAKEGSNIAICVSIIDMGTQADEKYGKSKRKVYFVFEIVGDRVDITRDGCTKSEPRLLGRTLTASLHEQATLRRELESWRGKSFTETELNGFDLKNVLGAPCELMVIHAGNNGKTTARIQSIRKMPADTDRPRPEIPLTFFSLDEQPTSIPAGVSPKIREKIEASPEWKALQDKKVADDFNDNDDANSFDDGIPF